ncbi:MAG: YbhB/YbcL family Raf kinase inhibitor-like protein [Planctomycetes bacterium]|nr:YbhB/YbcL family Raf kinase inhibitor-like protein [Planctomycetota bacterium]
MKKAIYLILAAFALQSCAAEEQPDGEEETPESSLVLTSSDFEAGGRIPAPCTCDGEDKSPQLSWSGAPAGTKSFALSIIDPDAPRGEWIHWLIVNIPADITSIPANGPLLEAATQIENSFGRVTYGGPCPPSGTHRYFHTVYALDVEKLEGVTKMNFVEVVESHSLAKGELIGLYSRR